MISHRFLVTLTVMLVAVAEVLDMTIVNVALPHMMGSLGANAEQITWVLTSYIVCAAVCMPLTGFLVKRMGRKRLLLTSIIGFLASSFLCGLSTSLSALIFFRSLQGIFGAALVPLAQYILRDTYPREEINKAMAIWGIGIMAGPILGPTLGGIITDSWSWRWVFYINVPVCLISLAFAVRIIEETPKVKEKIDWIGVFLLTMGVGCLQIFLDRGNSNDWFESHLMQVLAILAATGIIGFIMHARHHPHPVINLRLFRNRNFAVCTLIITTFVAMLFGLLALQPILMENVMGYSSRVTGNLMAPRGIASALSMMIVSKLSSKIDLRLILILGLICTALGAYGMSTFAVTSTPKQIILMCVIQGFGLGLFFVPLSSMAFASLAKEDVAEASGLFSFGRSLGASIGISILSTLITRQEQAHWHTLVEHVTPTNPNLSLWLSHQHWQLKNPVASVNLMHLIQQQAGLMAFVDVAFICSLTYIALLPMIFSLKRQPN